VLRCDDRGVGKSTGDLAAAGLTELVSDVQAAVAYLRGRDDVDPGRIGLVGHSEGGTIAPIVAEKDAKVRAIFLMAGTGKSLDKIIREQTELALKESSAPREKIEEVLAQQEAYFDAVRSSTGDYLERAGSRTFVRWLREHFNHDPAAQIARVRCFVLVLQGMKDKQVFPDNADILEKAMKTAGKTNFEVKRFETLDHLFMVSRGGISDYGDPSRRLDEEFLKLLAENVARELK
jgi:dienelactone hydrolase